MIDALRTLLRLCLGPEEESARRQLSEFPVAGWQVLLAELDSHRISPLVASRLRQTGLDSVVPRAIWAELSAAHRSSMLVMEVHARALRELLPALRRVEVHPILFKGVVLGCECYPDPGARPMLDVDVLVEDGELKRTVRVLNSLGYRRRCEGGRRHTTGFQNELGLAVDLHWRFELYAPATRRQMVREIELAELGSIPVRTWEPNAQLVHLVNHLHGHRREVGLRLGWLLDIAFLMQVHADELQLSRVKELAPCPSIFAFLGRILAFLRRELGVDLPPQLDGLAGGYRSYPLAFLIRESRLRPWGFPGLKGLGSVARDLIRGRQHDFRYPRLSDLALWPIDALAGWRPFRIGTATPDP